jgi:hypothetical protein
MQILIDADACPVTDIAITAARRRGIPVTLFCDAAHHMARAGATTVTVLRGADSADFALVNRVQAGDIVITQDYGLAAMALARWAYALNQNGMAYTDENIDALLLARHTAREVRMAGGRTKGPPKRTAAQDAAFRAALEALLARLIAPMD